MNVVFRKFRTGDVIALFCNSAEECNPGHIMSYMHIGQHGETSRQIRRYLKLATEQEYAPLLSELRGIYAPEPINAVKRLVA